MAEEDVVVAVSAPSDLKRKHEELEPEVPEAQATDSNGNGKENQSNDEVESDPEEEIDEKEAIADGDSDESEAKRPRLEEKHDELVTNNGTPEKEDKPEDDAEQTINPNTKALEDAEQPAAEASEIVNTEPASTDEQPAGDIQPAEASDGNPQLGSVEQQTVEGELLEQSSEVPQQGVTSSVEEQPASETQVTTRRMEVPNNKVGVLIGKAGDTIRFLQMNSGAKIQIMRDMDSDPNSPTRPVELIGTVESISKAEKLIKDVIAEADAGGSPALVARGFSTAQDARAAEQVLIQVPNEKVGLIIGKGGETIKNLQTSSGARIQLIPQNKSEEDRPKERTVRISGDKKQIEMAREMIKEVMAQIWLWLLGVAINNHHFTLVHEERILIVPVRQSPASGGYNQQQGFRPRGAAGQQQWGSRGPHPSSQQSGYDYQRGSYSQNNPPQGYRDYPPQQMAPRNSFRPPQGMQGPPPKSGGYDFYGGQGHMGDGPTLNPGHGPGPSPAGPHPSQANYNYKQPHGPEYGQPAPYSQAAPPPQGYGGHGYNEQKYENQAPVQYPYGAQGGPQVGGYPQGGGPQPGYAGQDQYGKAPPYGMAQAHGPPAQQHYGQPRPTQPGDVPYQNPVSSTQQYGQTALPPQQQTYPYAATGPVQQTYPSYGSAAPTDGYNQQPLPATGPAPVYAQQGVQQQQPVAAYGQPGAQQAYGAYGQPGGYASYPAQPGYAEQQPTPNTGGYGYPVAVDPNYAAAPAPAAYGAPPAGQVGYAQPAPAQAVYDQSVQQPGGYGGVPGGAPAGYA